MERDSLIPLKFAIIKYREDTGNLLSTFTYQEAKVFLIKFVTAYQEILKIQRIDNELMCDKNRLEIIDFKCIFT